MGKCQLKYDKPFAINTPSITSGYNKKKASSIQKTVENVKPQAYKSMNILDPHGGLKVLL